MTRPTRLATPLDYHWPAVANDIRTALLAMLE